MTAKELQLEFLAKQGLNIKEKPNDLRVSEVATDVYITHIRKQAATITRLLGRFNGIHAIKEGFRNFPELLESELKRFENEQTTDTAVDK